MTAAFLDSGFLLLGWYRNEYEVGCVLVIQDDCFSNALHLDEIILSSIPTAVSGGGAFAFASKEGLSAIFDSDEFRTYYRKYRFDLIIGVDAVTDIGALEKALELSRTSKGSLRVRAYCDQGSRFIFHPKFVWLRDQDVSNCATIVGSGNLTLSGLQSNVEAFSWNSHNESSINEVVNTWDRWVEECEIAGRLYDIDDSSIRELALRNIRQKMKIGSRAEEVYREGDGLKEVSFVQQESPSVKSKFSETDTFICGIPRQTGRGWSQFNMPKKYFQEYFGFDSKDSESNRRRRILMQSVDESGALGEVESRTGVISSTSSNYRIELQAAKGLSGIPKGENPYVVFLKVGSRSYRYTVICPNSAFFGSVLDFAKKHDSKHRKNQLYRCIVPSLSLYEAMLSLPLLEEIGVE